MKSVFEMKHASHVDVYVIMKNKEHWGKIIIEWSDQANPTALVCWNYGDDYKSAQYKATGWGYDKRGAAIGGAMEKIFGRHELLINAVTGGGVEPIEQFLKLHDCRLTKIL